MWNLKKNDINELIYKTEQTNRYRKQTYGYQRGQWGGQINQGFGINIYTLLRIKQINNKDILYSTGNYIQCLVINYNEKESEKEYVYVCITESLCCIPEANTTL